MIFHDVSPPSPPSPPSRPGVSAGPSIRLGISCCAPSPSAAATYSRIKAQLCASPHSLQLCRSGRRARGGATQLYFLRLSAESEKKPESIRRHQKIPSEVPEKPPVATTRSYNTKGHSNQARSEWPIAKGREKGSDAGAATATSTRGRSRTYRSYCACLCTVNDFPGPPALGTPSGLHPARNKKRIVRVAERLR